MGIHEGPRSHTKKTISLQLFVALHVTSWILDQYEARSLWI
jgi:hypothetical protein